jgi:hypothetical protein
MRVAALCTFYELIDNVPRRGLVRVAHAKIDYVFAALASGGLQLAGNVKHIRRKTLDSRELLHGKHSNAK